MLRLFPMIKDKKHIIFDYNGTILYDTHICVEILNELLQSHQLPAITESFYREIFHFPIASFYTQIGFDFKKENFDQLGKRYMKIYLSNIHRCKVYNGMRALLEQLKQSSAKVSILTALNHEALHEQLKLFNLDHYFDAAFGLADHHALSKIQRGHELMTHVGVPPNETLIIGDTDHDLEVAQSLGIEAILLADGHQDEARLRSKKATVINLERVTE